MHKHLYMFICLYIFVYSCIYFVCCFICSPETPIQYINGNLLNPCRAELLHMHSALPHHRLHLPEMQKFIINLIDC